MRVCRFDRVRLREVCPLHNRPGVDIESFRLV